jgi:hypothetical protein
MNKIIGMMEAISSSDKPPDDAVGLLFLLMLVVLSYNLIFNVGTDYSWFQK